MIADVGQQGTADHPRIRRMRSLAAVVAVVLAFAAGGVVASRFMSTPSQQAANAEAPPPSVITATVERRTVEDALVTRGDVVVLEAVDVLAGRRLVAEPAVLTKGSPAAGDEAVAGSPVVEINGRPVLLLPGRFPAYEDLGPGSSGPLVAQLQTALASLGRKSGDPSGTFGDSTAAAVRALYQAAGYPAQDRLPMAEVAFVPSLPAKVASTTAVEGANAASASLVIAAGKPVVVIKSDVQLLQAAGDKPKVRLANELTGDSADGTLQQMTGTMSTNTGNSKEPEGKESRPEHDGHLVVVPDKQLPSSWLGANVRVTVVLGTNAGETLAVPVSAVRTDATGRTVVSVMREGEPIDVEVVPGLTGGGFVQIDGQIAAGDEVVVGADR